MKKYYVYIHRRMTDGKIFYVGKGSGKRAWTTQGRRDNTYWGRTVDKHGFTVEIVAEDLSEPCAFTMEKILISIFRGNGMPLANLTPGGDGVTGVASTRRIPVLCSNGMTFESGFAAEGWLRANGHPDAVRSHFSYAANCNIPAAYGFAWWREGDEPRVFVSKGERMKMRGGRMVYCSNGMSFISIKEAARWVRVNTEWQSAVASNIATCCNGGLMTAYGFSWSFTSQVPIVTESSSQRVAMKLRKPVASSCGMEFPSQIEAQTWLRANGYPEARQGNISTAISRGSTVYGRKWRFL